MTPYRHTTTGRRTGGTYQHQSELGGAFETTRPSFDWFDCLCAVVIVALTIGTVAFILRSAAS